MRKEALGLGGLGTAALGFAKNSKNLGTMIGAGVGAAGGLASGLRKDQQGNRHIFSGVAQGVTGGVAGAGVGHAAQNIGGALNGGATLGDAVKGYGKGVADTAKKTWGKVTAGGPGGEVVSAQAPAAPVPPPLPAHAFPHGAVSAGVAQNAPSAERATIRPVLRRPSDPSGLSAPAI